MEEKQLDFNRPLLSVRRYNNTTPTTTQTEATKTYDKSRLPHYKSQHKTGPITNPGVVPFQWEHIPGQPKQQQINPQSLNQDRPPIVPKLPPGRYLNPNHQHSNDSNSPRATYQPEKVENSKPKKEKEDSDSGDTDEEAYVDALDTLSRTESFFLNCSNTGLSEFDDTQIVKPSRSVETRDFMMDRFLPAAKAMVASEMPVQYAPRRQLVVHEQGRHRKEIVVANENKPSLRYGPSFAKRYYDKVEEQESEDESDMEDNSPAVCGLLPRFCLRSSIGRLSPVPAMSVRTRVPNSPARVKHTRSSSSASYNNSEIEAAENEDNKTHLRNESGQSEIQLHCDVPKVTLIKDFALHGSGFKTSGELSVDSGSSVEKTLYIEYKVDGDGEAKSPLNGDFNVSSSIDDSKMWWLNISKDSGENTKVTEKEGTESIDKQQSGENCNKDYYKLPVPPPLPKSPSDSWLWRTLPSTKKLPLRMYLESATNTPKHGSSPTNDMKWENIVKTTKEMLTTVPET